MTDLGGVIGPPDWEIYFRRREQAGVRPSIVLSNDSYNKGESELIVVVPVTSKLKYSISTHLRITPPEGGLWLPGVVLCDQVRSISRHFLLERLGRVEDHRLRSIEEQLRTLLDFS